MRVLGVGHSCDLGAMYLQLAADGAEVRVYSRDFMGDGIMAGMLTHVPDYHRELDWIRQAGPDGVIVFETVEHGEEQDQLRREGFSVIGGSAFGDRLENDRSFGQAVLADAGMSTIASHSFDDFERAAAFVAARPARYVFKLDGSETASFRNYVGRAPDGSDLLALLRGQRARLAQVGFERNSFILMEHVPGIETGIGGYFNGDTFLEPTCLDWEHKRFFPGDLGELTGEMGTLATFRDAGTLFDLTLAKLTPSLRASGYVGYINLNTIINEHGIWPLELTCRFGYPGFAVLHALQRSPWDALFRSVLRQTPPCFDTSPGFAVGVVLTVPPFPYRYGYEELSRGLPIALDATVDEATRRRLYWSEVARDTTTNELVTSGSTGYLAVATGIGPTVKLAQQHAYALAERVYVPNLRYRTDIGTAFRRTHARELRRLGYLGRAGT